MYQIMEHPPITDKSPKTWIIIGSKRGGTSFLAQVLGENGVEIDHCGNGHNEDLDFVRFNELVLKDAGGDWNNLPPDSAIGRMVEKYKDMLLALLGRKSKDSWGWKDPRQGATIKHFYPYLKDDVYLVCVFRRPDKAAESMNRTWPQHSVEYSKSVIKDYYKRIVDALDAFIEFDWENND